MEKKQRLINGLLLSRVNVLAHELGVAHEASMRSVLLLELERMVECGIALEAQHLFLDIIERKQKNDA